MTPSGPSVDGQARPRPHRSIDHFAPPISEQKAIVAVLDSQTAKIDALIVKVRQAIDSLREYRTALISAAVTGKIDVRQEAKK